MLLIFWRQWKLTISTIQEKKSSNEKQHLREKAITIKSTGLNYRTRLKIKNGWLTILPVFKKMAQKRKIRQQQWQRRWRRCLSFHLHCSVSPSFRHSNLFWHDCKNHWMLHDANSGLDPNVDENWIWCTETVPNM